MKTFDVRIESTRAAAIQFRVAGDSWVSAWHEALSALGDPTVPADASCVVTQSWVEVECPSHERRFVIEQLPALDRRVVVGHPMLVGADGDLVPVQITAEPRTRSSRRATVRGVPLSSRRVEPTPPTSPELSRDAAPAQKGWRQDSADPIARVLTDLERQRLLARPVRINPKTGLPTPIEVASLPLPEPKSRATPRTDTIVADRGPGPVADRRVRIDLPAMHGAHRTKTPPTVPRPREVSHALGGLPGLDQSASLPQQFRPVLDDVTPPSGPALFTWAADTAWQHVPCALSMVLQGPEPLLVLAARGLREREAIGGRVVRDNVRGQWHLRPSVLRIRYADGALLVIEHPDGNRWDLRIDAALSVPVEGAALSLLLLDSPRPTGFTDGEASALTYLARTVAQFL